jgi:hypothetical protein
VGVRRRHLAQGGHRLLRSPLLNVTHDSIEQDDRKNCDRFVGQCRLALIEPKRCRNHCRDEQQDNQHVVKLGKKLPPSGHRLFRSQLVPAVALESRPRLRFAQAELRVDTQRCQ